MDATQERSNVAGLEALALRQSGYFDRGDALAHHLSDRALSYHVQTGRFERVFPGVFRLRNAPYSPHDDLWRAWVWTNYRGAIARESALAFYGLSDVMPSQVQLTAPPAFNRRVPAEFAVQRARLTRDDLTVRDGIAVTTPARSIIDAAAAGADPAQIQRAVHEALQRGLVAVADLRSEANRSRYRHSYNVRRQIAAAIRSASVHATT